MLNFNELELFPCFINNATYSSSIQKILCNTQRTQRLLIANLKTVSSRYLRKEYTEHLSKYFWKPYFWSKSYGIKSISRGAELDKILEYVQNQKKPAQ